jgi:hypothetical protein
MTGLDFLITQNRVVDSSQSFIESITKYIDADNPPLLTATAMGGYATAQLNLSMPEVDAYRLLSRIGCRLKVMSPLAQNASNIVWDGMIYTISIDDGRNAVNRSLANLYNQVRVSYSTITFDASGNQVFGTQVTTADANNATSQALYGIRELKYAIGGATQADAEQLRNTLLSQYQNPLATQTNARRGGGGSLSNVRVQLDAVGWWETLDKRFYVQTAITASGNVDVPLKAGLTSVGQFINSDQAGIASNTFQTTRYSEGSQTSQSYFSKLCALGGPNSRRFYLQILDDARPSYFEEPITIAYRARRLDATEAVYDASTGAVVPPWAVLPGRIISFDDLLPDAFVYSSALLDARTFLIGETRFTAPASLQMIPYTKDPSQLNLTRMGLAGN